ncbi:hypothetical protein ABTG41_01185, partial [Acinetobacter baumannii]
KNLTMAKFHITAIVLFCLLTLSFARVTPENDDVTTSVSLPVSDVSTKLRLPSETESKSAVPLTAISLHLINRRFPMRSKRPCHHHKDHVKIHYGNDMIVSSGENSDFDNLGAIHGVERRWIRLHHHHHDKHHDEDSDSDSDSDDEDDEHENKIKRHDHNRFDGKMAWKKMRTHWRIHHEEEEKRAGFMKRVGDFFGRYF